MMSQSFTFSRTLHWIIAMLVIAALASGYAMTSTDTFLLPLLQVHLAFGILAGLLTLFRVLIWFTRGAPPHIFAVSSRLQKIAGNQVHGLLRLVPLALPASGAAMVALSGSFPAILDGSLAGLAVFQQLPPRNLHHMMAFLLAILVFLHVGAAYWHWRNSSRLGSP